MAQVLRKKIANFLQTTCQRKFAHFSFSWLKIRLLKILQKFLHIWNGMVKGFSIMYIFSFFGQIFLQIFLLYNWILRYKIQFLQICKFFADSKSRAQELFIDVSFVIFGHQTWDLEGGGSNWPPPSISLFSSTPAGIGLKHVCQNYVKRECSQKSKRV